MVTFMLYIFIVTRMLYLYCNYFDFLYRNPRSMEAMIVWSHLVSGKLMRAVCRQVCAVVCQFLCLFVLLVVRAVCHQIQSIVGSVSVLLVVLILLVVEQCIIRYVQL